MFGNRKINFHLNLSAIFTSLITGAVAFIIIFSYFRTSSSIINGAKVSVGRASSIINERIDAFVEDVDQVSDTTLGLIPPIDQINPQNKALITYMFAAVRSFPLIYSHYIGTKDGNFLQVVNLKAAGRETFLSDKEKYLPRELDLALRFLDRSQSPPTEKWVYKNKKLETIAEETLVDPKYDPRVRPWYIGAKENKQLVWTGVYTYNTLVGAGAASSGISAGQPFYNKSGELQGVIGTDVTLATMSDFISKQKIAQTGKAFVLDKKGEIIVPFEEMLQKYPRWYTPKILSEPVKAFKEKNEKILDFDFDGETYLSEVRVISLAGGNDWYILFIVPIKEFLYELLKTQKLVMMISIGILLISIVLVYIISKRTAKPIRVLSSEVDKIKHFDLSSEFRVKSSIGEIVLLDESIASMRGAIRSFSSYVPKEIVRKMIEKGMKIGLGGTRKEVTVLFTDISGFTSIVEKLPTDQFMNMLAEYYDNMSKIILSEQGTIDKYIGDSIMAFWGAPTEVEDPNIKACTCLLSCQAYIKTFNQKQEAANQPPFQTRFGLDYGPAIVGNIGTEERMNYTVIGDTVNTAARLQNLCPTYGATFLVTENVACRLDHQFHMRPLDFLAVKGKTTQIRIYELVGKKEGDSQIQAPPERIELCHMFTDAYNVYHQNDLAKSKELFQKILEKFPDDIPTKMYLERIEKPQEHPG